MELLTMICLAVLGVLLFTGGLAMIGMIAALTVVLLRQSKDEFAIAWRRLWRREATNGFAQNRSSLRNSSVGEMDARVAVCRVSNSIAAMGLTTISGYILWVGASSVMRIFIGFFEV